MTITLELPNNKKEAAFLLQLLQKLNVSFKKEDDLELGDLPEELVQLLEERLIDLEENPDSDMSLEDFDKKYYEKLSV